MNYDAGQNKKGVKSLNQRLVLKLVATRPGLSRVDIAKITGLTKMTAGNIVGELIDNDIIQEDAHADGNGGVGRSPIHLKISDRSPCILGISIKRGLYQIILADLAGTVLDKWVYGHDDPIGSEQLVALLKQGIDQVRLRNRRRLLGTGISCVGPVNRIDGVVLNPSNFWNIKDLPIVDIVAEHTGLPAFLVNDGNSGALAEKTYGAGRNVENFFYLHIMYGIGAGLVLDGRLYNGVYGHSGEIGHVTINFAGPRCGCGNTGCLELYANIENMRRHISELSALFPDSSIARHASPTLLDVIDAANMRDNLAIAALDQFCVYLSHAIYNTITLLDLSCVIADYPSRVAGAALETILQGKMANFTHMKQYKALQIVRSGFNGAAPLMGSVALIADMVFQGQLPLPAE